MKILVTGGAGLIGSHLVEQLLSLGHQVNVLDNLSTGRTNNIRQYLGNQDFVFIEGNILQPENVLRAAAGCETIYHLAAAVGVSNILANPLQGILTNTRGTENVFDAAFRNGAKVLYASTSEIYGKSTRIPFNEDDDRVLGPTTVSRWSYSTAKALGEHLALAYADRGLRVVIVRYFNSYGPRTGLSGYGGVVTRFVSQALQGAPITIHGEGDQTRCFCYVGDTVKGSILAATAEKGEGEIFNIGSAAETSILELALRIKELTRSSSPIVHLSHKEVFGSKFEDIKRRVPNVRKAETLLGFRAKVALNVGLRKTIDWISRKADSANQA